LEDNYDIDIVWPDPCCSKWNSV